jgi:chondroitin AC lyase
MPASYTGATTFVGGVSDGTLGAAGFDYARNGVTGRKAWFFFDKEIVGLGAGISAAAGKPVYTSVNQCLAKGAVLVRTGAGAAVQDFGIHRITQASWVWHDSVGYFFPDGGDSVFAGNSAQTGSWLSINTTGAAAIITDTVFSLWLDHGTAPANATYAYGVIPGIGEDSLDAYGKSGACTVVSNTAALQAVRDNALGACGIIFYVPGTVALSDTLAVGVDRACAALVRESADSMEIAVSNPAGVACTVQVTATIRLWGNGAVWNAQTATTTAPFILPGGLDAGGSVVQTFGRHATAAGPVHCAVVLRAVSIRRTRAGITVDFGANTRMRGARVTVLDVSGKRIGSAQDRRRTAATLEVMLPSALSGIIIVVVQSGTSARTFVLPAMQ